MGVLKHKKYRNSTGLSKYIRQLKDTNVSTIVTWKLIAKVLFEIKINFFKSCLTDKALVKNSLKDNQLSNKKSELISTCRHQCKLLLKCLKKK